MMDLYPVAQGKAPIVFSQDDKSRAQLGVEQTCAPKDGHILLCHFSVAADPRLAGTG